VRRWRKLGLVFQMELAGLGALVLALAFWQLRLPLAAAWHRSGPGAAAMTLAFALLALALASAGAAATRLSWLLRSSPLRPAWLQWPLPEAVLWGHLRWEARARALVPSLLAPSFLLAGWGYVPGWALAALALGFAAALELLVRAACRVSLAAAARGNVRPPRASPLLRSLSRVTDPPRRAARLTARWRLEPAWLAWWRKDAQVARRSRSGRPQLLLGILLALASVLVWFTAPPNGRPYLLALGLAMAALGAVAEWLVALCGRDPFVAIRSLPLAVHSVWLGRFAWVVLATAPLLAAHLALMPRLVPQAPRLFAFWLGGAGFGLGALAVNYGLTLFPRAEVAQRLLYLSLGLVLLALVLFPPIGGVVALLAALIHSARRLPVWHRLEGT
jgi:hypothetical protein